MEIKKLIVGMVQTNCYIAINPGIKEAVVVDPGGEADRIRSEVQRLGVKAQAILLTHGHFDHVMAMEELKAGWGVPIYACEKEAEILADPGKNLTNQFLGGGSRLKADVLLKNQETVRLAGYEFKLLHTPYRFPNRKRASDGRLGCKYPFCAAGRYGRVSGPYGGYHDWG